MLKLQSALRDVTPLVRGALLLCSLILPVLANFNVSGKWILLHCFSLFLKQKRAQEIPRCIVWRFTFAELHNFCNIWQENFKVPLGAFVKDLRIHCNAMHCSCARNLRTNHIRIHLSKGQKLKEAKVHF